MAIAVYTVAMATVLVLTGWWRRVFFLVAIRQQRMTVKRLGLMVSAPPDVTRVDTILRSFARGFNTMLTAASMVEVRRCCESTAPLYRPFAEEGVAMGYVPRGLFRYRARDFEQNLVRPAPEFRYLHYVGLGFWSGMRHHSPQTLSRIVQSLDTLHGYLCYDGYGFKHAFFDYPMNPGILRRLDGLEGYARNAAYQGVGRAFWFRFMDQPAVLIDHLHRLGEYASDAAAGVGLAAAFVNPDRLDVARDLALTMPADWRDNFHLGLCFALKARSINDLDEFSRDMGRLDARVQEAVYASIRECDRVELQVRADNYGDKYRRWRERVTEWMSEHIEYPLAAVKVASVKAPDEVAAVR